MVELRSLLRRHLVFAILFMLKNIFPFLNDDDIVKGIHVFNEFPGWYLVEKCGCVAFGLEVVESKSSFYLRKEEQDNDDEF